MANLHSLQNNLDNASSTRHRAPDDLEQWPAIASAAYDQRLPFSSRDVPPSVESGSMNEVGRILSGFHVEACFNPDPEIVSGELEKKPHGHNIKRYKVDRNMLPSGHDLLVFLKTRNPGDHRLKGYLTAQTNDPPGNQDFYAARATRSYEEKAMRELVNLAYQHKQITQKELVDAVMRNSPDQESAVLTLANLTKNLAALYRGRNEPGDASGVTASGVKCLKNRSYGASDAIEVLKAMDIKSSKEAGSLYHFYGALATTYFLGRTGEAMVEAETRTHNDEKKQEANRAGQAAGLRLRNYHHKVSQVETQTESAA